MAFDAKKYGMSRKAVLRDNRPFLTRVAETLRKPDYGATFFIIAAGSLWFNQWALALGDVMFVFMMLYLYWLVKQDRTLMFKLPFGSPYKDKNSRNGKGEGILYLGNTEKGEEMWFSNSDARTHVLYLGTTGSGKTEGLKSMVTNAMSWGSGFVYVDGKADTDLWSSLSSLVRRFGRDDDLLVLNYMTGNTDSTSPSNTMNPFSSGSASYLTNMLVSLMPEAEGDNAMWKERAVSLASAMMPVMTFKRDKQDVALSVRTIRDNLSLNNVIKLQRDETVPLKMREGLKGYLDTLPGFVHDAFDDQGKQKPPGPGTPNYDTTTSSQQHGYLAMQFTRALQSLGDDYGYIFDTQAADVDMVDVVLNRRILVVLIPALEKSGDEIANLGKIIASTMKGMMGSTLGSTVEGTAATVIENKPTHSATPFMTVFDEVGYYTAQGMAVMAAQARSLGFCLVFSGQDLPAMKKRVREEANSITANCNIKIFGKLEDPTETKEFYEKTIGDEIVAEVSNFETSGGSTKTYYGSKSAGIQHRAIISYDEIRTFKEGEAAVCFGKGKTKANMFYSNPGHAKAMRVTRFLALPPASETMSKHAASIGKLRDLMVNKTWTAERADVGIETSPAIAALVEGFKTMEDVKAEPITAGIGAIVQVYGLDNPLDEPLKQIESPAAKSIAAPTTAAPITSPLPIPAKSAESVKTENTEAKGPMGFFTAPKTTTETAAPPVTQAAKIETPKQETPAAPPPATPVQKTPEIQKPKELPAEIQNILKAAGKEVRTALFKDKDKGNIDAAE